MLDILLATLAIILIAIASMIAGIVLVALVFGSIVGVIMLLAFRKASKEAREEAKT